MLDILFFFQRFSAWFKVLMIELLNNLIGLLFVLSVYFALWHFPQTIDLLLILNQADSFILEVPLYFGLLLISAFLIWNLPKYFYYHNHKDITFLNFIGFIPNQHYRFQSKEKDAKYPYLLRIHMRKTVPRILATLLLTISSLGILNAMELFELTNTYTGLLNPTNTLVICILFLTVLTEPNFYNYIQKRLTALPGADLIITILPVVLVAYIIVLGTLNTQAEDDLKKLFLSNCALAVLFFILAFNSYTFLKIISKRMFYGSILTAGFLFLLFFVLLNIFPGIATDINPLSVLMISLTSLFMISFILILLGKKVKLPLLTIVFLLSIFSASYFSRNSNHYELVQMPASVHRYDINEYIYYWIIQRKNSILSAKDSFPVIIVSSEGGGSRAGLWSLLVHSYLYEKSNGKYFEEHLLSLTGASGGSVGNAMFFSRAVNIDNNTNPYSFKLNSNSEYQGLTYKASAVYKENFLSEALLSLLGRDLFKEITNLFTFNNRGQLLEDQWSNAHMKFFSKRSEDNLLGREFLSFYKDVSKDSVSNKKNPPLLFINTTHTQTGNYNLVSPVTYANAIPLSGMDDFISKLQQQHPNMSIAMVTAARINASFPYITPVGEIKGRNRFDDLSDQYADAGYYDNLGGRVSKGVEDVFKKVLQDSFPELIQKIHLKHLVITNSSKKRSVKKQNQLAAPLTTLKNVRAGHTLELYEKLENKTVIQLESTPIKPISIGLSADDKGEFLIKPVLPLGRYLSTVAIQSVEARLEVVSSKLDSILELK